MKVLVTGGAGYIGSHNTLALLESGFEVVSVTSRIHLLILWHALKVSEGKISIKGDLADRLLEKAFLRACRCVGSGHFCCL